MGRNTFAQRGKACPQLSLLYTKLTLLVKLLDTITTRLTALEVAAPKINALKDKMTINWIILRRLVVMVAKQKNP